MKCPKCNFENPEFKEMCQKCGYPIKPIPEPIDGKIHFGLYDWFVLEEKENRMLLITQKVIEKRPYHNVEEKITWETSSIRDYLNHEFLQNFQEDERKKIIEVTNENKDNQWYGTEGGNPTKDRIFLLSLEEVIKYFGDSGQLEQRNKNEGCGWLKDDFFFFLSDQYNRNRRAVDDTETVVDWLLRSPGANGRVAAMVYGLDLRDPFDHGDISVCGGCGALIDGHMIFDDSAYHGEKWSTKEYGIRPALWISTE